MIKALGAALILGSCLISGLRSASELNMRVRSMKSILSSVEIMRGEVSSRLTSVTDIFKLLSENAEMPARRLYKNALSELANADGDMLQNIWRRAVEKTNELLLTDTEKLTLFDIGACLGRYDVKSQMAMLERIASRFEEFRARAEEDRRREIRLQTCLSVISGVFVVIILL